MGLQVGQILWQAARSRPDACAVVDLGHGPEQRRELSFDELHRKAVGVACWLAGSGVSAGDRVALVAENSAEAAAAFFGVLYAGASVVPLHVLSTAPELALRIEHAAVRVVLHDAARSDVVRDALALAPAVSTCLSSLDAFEADDVQRALYPLDMRAEAHALVLYTSGTTGEAKGAAISHASLLIHTLVLAQQVLQLDAAARVLCVLPLSHSYGCRLALLAPLYAGGRIVIMPRFDAGRSLRALAEESITWLPAVPTMFAAWGQLEAAAPMPQLRWALSAGAPLADETLRRAERVLGVEVRQGYGMTEATFATLNAPPDRRVLGSVGKPVWGVAVRIVDEAGRDVPPGQRGEVLVRGHNVMTQYLFDSAATQSALSDGWMHSGDIGLLDAEGRLSIVDRSKDLIIRGGYNVYPSEIENVLGAHPGVQAVSVVGRPDAFYGEEVVAFVVPVLAPAPTPNELRAFIAQRLARHKLPREFVFVDRLPLGPSGKIHKRTLREMLVTGQYVPQKGTL